MKRFSLLLLPAAVGVLITYATAQTTPSQPRGGERRGGQPLGAQPNEGAREDAFGRHSWKAFIELSAEQKPLLRVEGIMTAPTPGHYAIIKPAEPQGFNPRILILNITHKQLPGMWTQALTDIPVCFHAPLEMDQFDQVTVLAAGGAGKTLDIVKPERR